MSTAEWKKKWRKERKKRKERNSNYLRRLVMPIIIWNQDSIRLIDVDNELSNNETNGIDQRTRHDYLSVFFHRELHLFFHVLTFQEWFMASTDSCVQQVRWDLGIIRRQMARTTTIYFIFSHARDLLLLLENRVILSSLLHTHIRTDDSSKTKAEIFELVLYYRWVVTSFHPLISWCHDLLTLTSQS